ncbi:MAG TPA: sugar phosphate nucleotidyltransferase, partial [Vicinamibacteria bacterium]|nr:sugar phosphate nucleotidyltransferase [Vicinamibacteria bacterium]
QMDFRKMLDTHRRHVADATVAVLPVSAEQAGGFGILKVNRQGRIVHFEEKPKPERLPDLLSDVPGIGPTYLASMGIYLFGQDALAGSMADPSLIDFGKDVIPRALQDMRVHAHPHRGYWEDVGTIRSYFDANLALARTLPPFDFYEAARPVFTHPRFLPATKVEACAVRQALISEGCILVGAEIERAVIGIRSRIGSGTQIRDSLVLGADFYETVEEMARAQAKGLPAVGIGADSVISNTIVDKNARIGRGVRIADHTGDGERDGEGFYIRDGIVVVPKNAVIADGTVI